MRRPALIVVAFLTALLLESTVFAQVRLLGARPELIVLVVALVAYRMPFTLAIMSSLYGAAFGIFPIAWIVFASIMLYRLAVDTGKFEIIKDSVGGLTNDRRLQAMFIAFSFGAFVTSHVIAALHPAREIEQIVLVGTAAARFEVAPIPAALHERTLVIHGEADDTVPLASAMDWARPQGLPILVVPGGGHFFHGQLPQLKQWVARHLRA